MLNQPLSLQESSNRENPHHLPEELYKLMQLVSHIVAPLLNIPEPNTIFSMLTPSFEAAEKIFHGQNKTKVIADLIVDSLTCKLPPHIQAALSTSKLAAHAHSQTPEYLALFKLEDDETSERLFERSFIAGFSAGSYFVQGVTLGISHILQAYVNQLSCFKDGVTEAYKETINTMKMICEKECQKNLQFFVNLIDSDDFGERVIEQQTLALIKGVGSGIIAGSKIMFDTIKKTRGMNVEPLALYKLVRKELSYEFNTNISQQPYLSKVTDNTQGIIPTNSNSLKMMELSRTSFDFYKSNSFSFNISTGLVVPSPIALPSLMSVDHKDNLSLEDNIETQEILLQPSLSSHPPILDKVKEFRLDPKTFYTLHPLIQAWNNSPITTTLDISNGVKKIEISIPVTAITGAVTKLLSSNVVAESVVYAYAGAAAVAIAAAIICVRKVQSNKERVHCEKMGFKAELTTEDYNLYEANKNGMDDLMKQFLESPSNETAKNWISKITTVLGSEEEQGTLYYNWKKVNDRSREISRKFKNAPKKDKKNAEKFQQQFINTYGNEIEFYENNRLYLEACIDLNSNRPKECLKKLNEIKGNDNEAKFILTFNSYIALGDVESSRKYLSLLPEDNQLIASRQLDRLILRKSLCTTQNVVNQLHGHRDLSEFLVTKLKEEAERCLTNFEQVLSKNSCELTKDETLYYSNQHANILKKLRRNPVEIIKAYKVMQEVDPGNLVAALELSQIYAEEKNWTLALEELEKVMPHQQQPPELEQYFIVLKIDATQQNIKKFVIDKRYRDAIIDLDNLLGLVSSNSDKVSCYIQKARIHEEIRSDAILTNDNKLAQEAENNAIQAYQEVLYIEPGNHYSVLGMIQIYCKQGKILDAANALKNFKSTQDELKNSIANQDLSIISDNSKESILELTEKEGHAHQRNNGALEIGLEILYRGLELLKVEKEYETAQTVAETIARMFDKTNPEEFYRINLFLANIHADQGHIKEAVDQWEGLITEFQEDKEKYENIACKLLQSYSDKSYKTYFSRKIKENLLSKLDDNYIENYKTMNAFFNYYISTHNFSAVIGWCLKHQKSIINTIKQDDQNAVIHKISIKYLIWSIAESGNKEAIVELNKLAELFEDNENGIADLCLEAKSLAMFCYTSSVMIEAMSISYGIANNIDNPELRKSIIVVSGILESLTRSYGLLARRKMIQKKKIFQAEAASDFSTLAFKECSKVENAHLSQKNLSLSNSEFFHTLTTITNKTNDILIKCFDLFDYKIKLIKHNFITIRLELVSIVTYTLAVYMDFKELTHVLSEKTMAALIGSANLVVKCIKWKDSADIYSENKVSSQEKKLDDTKSNWIKNFFTTVDISNVLYAVYEDPRLLNITIQTSSFIENVHTYSKKGESSVIAKGEYLSNEILSIYAIINGCQRTLKQTSTKFLVKKLKIFGDSVPLISQIGNFVEYCEEGLKNQINKLTEVTKIKLLLDMFNSEATKNNLPEIRKSINECATPITENMLIEIIIFYGEKSSEFFSPYIDGIEVLKTVAVLVHFSYNIYRSQYERYVQRLYINTSIAINRGDLDRINKDYKEFLSSQPLQVGNQLTWGEWLSYWMPIISNEATNNIITVKNIQQNTYIKEKIEVALSDVYEKSEFHKQAGNYEKLRSGDNIENLKTNIKELIIKIKKFPSLQVAGRDLINNEHILHQKIQHKEKEYVDSSLLSIKKAINFLDGYQALLVKAQEQRRKYLDEEHRLKTCIDAHSPFQNQQAFVVKTRPDLHKLLDFTVYIFLDGNEFKYIAKGKSESKILSINKLSKQQVKLLKAHMHDIDPVIQYKKLEIGVNDLFEIIFKEAEEHRYVTRYTNNNLEPAIKDLTEADYKKDPIQQVYKLQELYVVPLQYTAVRIQTLQLCIRGNYLLTQVFGWNIDFYQNRAEVLGDLSIHLTQLCLTYIESRVDYCISSNLQQALGNLSNIFQSNLILFADYIELRKNFNYADTETFLKKKKYIEEYILPVAKISISLGIILSQFHSNKILCFFEYIRIASQAFKFNIFRNIFTIESLKRIDYFFDNFEGRASLIKLTDANKSLFTMFNGNLDYFSNFKNTFISWEKYLNNNYKIQFYLFSESLCFDLYIERFKNYQKSLQLVCTIWDTMNYELDKEVEPQGVTVESGQLPSSASLEQDYKGSIKRSVVILASLGLCAQPGISSGACFLSSIILHLAYQDKKNSQLISLSFNKLTGIFGLFAKPSVEYINTTFFSRFNGGPK